MNKIVKKILNIQITDHWPGSVSHCQVWGKTETRSREQRTVERWYFHSKVEVRAEHPDDRADDDLPGDRLQHHLRAPGPDGALQNMSGSVTRTLEYGFGYGYGYGLSRIFHVSRRAIWSVWGVLLQHRGLQEHHRLRPGGERGEAGCGEGWCSSVCRWSASTASAPGPSTSSPSSSPSTSAAGATTSVYMMSYSYIWL